MKMMKPSKFLSKDSHLKFKLNLEFHRMMKLSMAIKKKKKMTKKNSKKLKNSNENLIFDIKNPMLNL